MQIVLKTTLFSTSFLFIYYFISFLLNVRTYIHTIPSSPPLSTSYNSDGWYSLSPLSTSMSTRGKKGESMQAYKVIVHTIVLILSFTFFTQSSFFFSLPPLPFAPFLFFPSNFSFLLYILYITVKYWFYDIIFPPQKSRENMHAFRIYVLALLTVLGWEAENVSLYWDPYVVRS